MIKEIRRWTVLEAETALLDDPDVVTWLLSGFAPLCYPKYAADDITLRAVLVAYDCGDGPHAPCDDAKGSMPEKLWDLVCEVATQCGLKDDFCYVRLNPVGDHISEEKSRGG